jgi:hypothetical protein
MTNPRQHGFPHRARLSGGRGKTRIPGRRRPSAVFVAAIAILLAGALLLAGGLAWAHGGGGKVWAPWNPVPEVAATTPVDVPTDLRPKEAGASGRAVCVRLCDGFFFPSATSAGGDDACAAQCPDAPTARYTEPVGSDRIEDAVSTSGALYTALPVANRYQTTLDSTCRCHRSPTRGYSAAVLNDPTLRRGDVVVTPKGFLVFQGAKTRSITPSDFVALSQARSLPKELRAVLVAMERASASRPQVEADSSPSASQRQSHALTPVAFAGSAK